MSDNDPDDLVGERRFTLPINPDPVTRRLQAEREVWDYHVIDPEEGVCLVCGEGHDE